MKSIDKGIKKILSTKVNGKWPKLKHNYTSQKYGGYVYNISINGRELWEGALQDMPVGTNWMWHFYSESEDECAKKVYKLLTKYLKRVTKLNNLSGGHYTRHKKWRKWISNYEQ